MEENNIIDVDDFTTEPVNEEPILYCKHAFPIYCHNVKGSANVVDITYLCRNFQNKMFTLNRAYLVEDSEETMLPFECLPFAEYETDHISRKLEFKWINNFLPHFTTNMQFYVEDDFFKEENPFVFTYAVDSNSKKKVKIGMTLETFISVLFIDKYPIVDIDSDHDLNLAVINGAVGGKFLPKIFNVENVDVISMVNAEIPDEPSNIFEKIKSKFAPKELPTDNTNVAMVLKVERSIGDDKETAQLLAAFDVGVTFDKTKFRGKTIDNIQDNYFKDSDQFTTTLMVQKVKLYGINKTYMIIRGINNEKKSYLFFFDSLALETIQNKINGY